MIDARAGDEREDARDDEHGGGHFQRDGQHAREQRQHDAAQLAHGGRHAEQECDHSGQQGQRHHHGGGKDFENDHISYLP